MLDFGYDEGGSSEVLLLSAQLGSCGSIRRLNRHWRIALDDAGVPFFHSKDYWNLSGGVFKGLSMGRRKRLLAKLSLLIQKQIDAGVTTRVNIPLYEANTTPEFRSKWGGSAYTFGVIMSAVAAHVYLQRVGRQLEKVNILVAKGHRNLMQALEHLEGIGPNLNANTVGWGLMKDWPILQAADMLAYSEWQKFTNGDLEIYKALHPNPPARYKTEAFDCTLDLVKTMTTAADDFKAARKVFWEQCRSTQVAPQGQM